MVVAVVVTVEVAVEVSVVVAVVVGVVSRRDHIANVPNSFTVQVMESFDETTVARASQLGAVTLPTSTVQASVFPCSASS